MFYVRLTVLLIVDHKLDEINDCRKITKDLIYKFSAFIAGKMRNH
jgi:hypothetical protein